MQFAAPTLRRFVRSPVWLRNTAIAAGILTLVFIGATLFAPFQADDFWGLVFGWCAAVLMVAVALYAARRRMLARAPGRSRVWLLVHLYGGLLFLLAMLFHTGFRLPDGAMNWLLWTLSLWVAASGVLGILVQKWIPNVLASALSVEAVYERIPELVAHVRAEADGVAAMSPGIVGEFYRRNVAGDMQRARFRPLFFLDITGGIQTRLRSFDYLKGVLEGGDADALERLRGLYRAKLELDAHYTLQRALRTWAYTHVPLSVVLLVLVVLHVWVAFYY